MAVDLLYVAHNRLRFTQATFAALIENTNWRRVENLYVIDDASTDGTNEFLLNSFDNAAPTKRIFTSGPFGGPVAVMNRALDWAETSVLVKIDNDVLVCPGWLDALLDVLDAAPELDVLGFEAGFGDGLAAAEAPRTWRLASHIGGVGAYRTRIFEKRRPVAHDRYFGLTEFLRRYAKCGWLCPDIPAPLLDHLPFEPWLSLTTEYVKAGWSRAWPTYGPEFEPYWSWWSDRNGKVETAGTEPAIPERRPSQEADVEQASYDRREVLGQG